jgi:two-component system, NarL family, response regulator LiaR
MTDEKKKPIRVLIADDHPAFRDGLCRLLDEIPDITVVARASDGSEAVKMVAEFRPDVAIVDVTMPVLDGIEATKQIKAVCADTNVLIVSAHSFGSYILAALKAGAAGYVLKTAALDEIVNAVRLLHAGEGVFDLKVGGRVLCRLAGGNVDGQDAVELLHPRELEVLRLAARGMGNKEIARELVISERTVHSHLIHIFRKLKVGSRTEAVLHALKEGWLTLEDLP